MKSRLLLFIMILTALASCNGRNTSHNSYKESYTAARGDTVKALDKTILIVFQASNDDYWFGSDGQGVYHYDGKTLINYTTKHGLRNNRIRDIQEDSSGNIFFSTLEGISKFDGKIFTTLTVTESRNAANDWKLQTGDMLFKEADQDKGGIFRYDGTHLYRLALPKHPKEAALFTRQPGTSFSPYQVYTIYKDSKGHIWFGTSCLGICRYDGTSFSWLYEEHLNTTPESGSFGIRSIIEDQAGKYWFCNTRYRYTISPGDSSGFMTYTREKGIEQLTSPEGKDHIYYMSVLEDNKNLWMATYGEGAWQYDGTTATHYPVKDGDKDIRLYSVYKDRHNTLWLGTHDGGAYKFNGKGFERFMP